MLFVNKFWPQLNYYNVTHDIPDLVFKSVLSLEEPFRVVFTCYFQMILWESLPSKCQQVLCAINYWPTHAVNIGAARIENNSSEKLLDVTIDAKLSFEKHVQKICAKDTTKLKILARIAPFMNIQKMKVMRKAIFTVQFSYCSLIGCFILES